MAMLNSARSRLLSAISSLTRMDQTCLGSKGAFLANDAALVSRRTRKKKGGQCFDGIASLLPAKPAMSSAMPI